MFVDPKLLELLVCPVTKTQLRYNADAAELVSDAAGLAFPIRDGVPVMMVSQARSLDAHERVKK
jgi:uncharacterized protein YbaR (Trm112 family)